MRLLRMLFKNHIKVFVTVDAACMPIQDENGCVSFRYQNSANAAVYSTYKKNLTMIPGTDPIDLDEAVLEVKPPKPKHQKLDSVDAPMPSDIIPPNTVVIYTDGGASPNPGPAGSGVIMLYGNNILEIWEYLGKTTNNIAELTAILRALENIKNKNIPILLYSDSNYAISVVTGRKNAVKNIELVNTIKNEIAKCPNLQILKVKAHVGIRYNHHVDRLCALARDTQKSGSRRSSSQQIKGE